MTKQFFARTLSPLALAATIGILGISSHEAHADAPSTWERGFVSPPQSARPQTWWHWMNGNITREGITADLEAMQHVGLGGAEIFNVDQGIPKGPVDFLSPEWRRMTAFAISEAKRLRLELCIHNSSGWSSSGGPWITPELAMQQVVSSEQRVTGPVAFSAVLPQPPTRSGYYRDIAVIAVPAQPGASTPGIAGLRTKADYERADNQGPATTSTALPQTFVAPTREIVLTAKLAPDGKLTWDVPAGDWTILRIGYTPTGAQNEPAVREGLGLECDKLSKHALDVHFAGMVQKVLDDSGPRVGNALTGVLIDSYEVGSQNWTPAFREEFRTRRGYDLLPFLPVLTGRVVDNPAVSERFLWDFRRTITDLFTENYYGHFAELCHERGLKFSTETYGNGPFDELADGGRADIPMAEFWVGGAALETVKLASSSGHTYGRNIIGAESFTAVPEHARWTNDPYSMKGLGDHVFSGGINRIIFHRYAMQPWVNRSPGMTMGPWGIHFERTNTWWNQGASWLQYLARCQYLLQQGTFVGDAAYYSGENAPIGINAGNPPLPPGYDYDGISRELLVNAMAVRNGRVTLPSGMSYSLLILPPSETMTPEVLRKVRQLVQAGATVYGARPLRSPSLQGYPNSDREVQALAGEVWGPVDGKKTGEHRLGKGRVLWGMPLSEVFAGRKVAPDFTAETAGAKNSGVEYLHRSSGDADIYFVATQRSVAQKAVCSFRVSGRVPEIWHPDTGRIETAPLYSDHDGRTTVTLKLDPSGSAFVVFRRPDHGVDHPVAITRAGPARLGAPAPVLTIGSAAYEAVDGVGGSKDVTALLQGLVQEGMLSFPASNSELGGDPAINHVKQLRIVYTLNGTAGTLTVGENAVVEIAAPFTVGRLPDYELRSGADGRGVIEASNPGTFTVTEASGRTHRAVVSEVAQPITLAGPWRLAFPPNLGAPAETILPELSSWTANDQSGIRYFSGTATYTKTVSIPADRIGAGKSLYLDLGHVKNLARVTVNGVDLGVFWKPPFRADISHAIHPGNNRVEIAVTNLWPNRLIGDAQLPDDAVWDGDHLHAWPQWLLDGKRSPTGHVAFATWKHWGKNDPLLPSGLLGPVRLLPSVTVEAR